MLHVAILCNDLNTLKHALNAGENLERKHDGMSALLYACSMGNDKFVNILLDRGADITSVSRRNETALVLAIGRREISLPTIKRLAADENINSIDDNDATPLMIACIHGRVGVVKFLLTKHVNVNAIDNERFTAMDCLGLHRGPYEERLAIAQLLIDSGINCQDLMTMKYMIGDDQMASLLLENDVFIADDLTYTSDFIKRKINANVTKVDVTTSDLQFLTQKKKAQLRMLIKYLPNELLLKIAEYL